MPVHLSDVRSPHYSRNRRRRTPEGCDGECLVCGLGLVEAKAGWIRMMVTGELVAHDAEIPEKLDQGCFPVGPECSKLTLLQGFVR